MGGEFLSRAMEKWLKGEGMKGQTSCPNTPSQNGDAERRIAYLLDMVRTLLAWSGLSGEWWGEAALAATHLINLLPTRALKEHITPHEAFTGDKPSISNLRVFGCQALVHIQKKDKQSKVGPNARECIHIRGADGVKGWVFYDPVSKQRFTSRDAVFLEGRPGKAMRGMGLRTNSLSFQLYDGATGQAIVTYQYGPGEQECHAVPAPAVPVGATPVPEEEEEEEEGIDPLAPPIDVAPMGSQSGNRGEPPQEGAPVPVVLQSPPASSIETIREEGQVTPEVQSIGSSTGTPAAQSSSSSSLAREASPPRETRGGVQQVQTPRRSLRQQGLPPGGERTPPAGPSRLSRIPGGWARKVHMEDSRPPETVTQAKKSPYGPQWEQAM
jgi:hypothetical protein